MNHFEGLLGPRAMTMIFREESSYGKSFLGGSTPVMDRLKCENRVMRP